MNYVLILASVVLAVTADGFGSDNGSKKEESSQTVKDYLSSMDVNTAKEVAKLVHRESTMRYDPNVIRNDGFKSVDFATLVMSSSVTSLHSMQTAVQQLDEWVQDLNIHEARKWGPRSVVRNALASAGLVAHKEGGETVLKPSATAAREFKGQSFVLQFKDRAGALQSVFASFTRNEDDTYNYGLGHLRGVFETFPDLLVVHHHKKNLLKSKSYTEFVPLERGISEGQVYTLLNTMLPRVGSIFLNSMDTESRADLLAHGATARVPSNGPQKQEL